MNHSQLSFIGAGNMARSLIGGLIADGHAPEAIYACAPTQENLDSLAQQYGIHTSTDNTVGIEHADVVILAVKPNIIHTVLAECADVIKQKNVLLLSVAAGVKIHSMERWLGDHSAIVRCMPNTPALIGTAATGLYANDHVNEAQKNVCETIMRSVGLTQWLAQESDLDIVTALSGSGPAYFYVLMEALQQAAEEQGLSKQTAHVLTLQTALGAARLALESEKDVSQLREYVTSPGGTTESALKSLHQNNVSNNIKQALACALKRANELAELLDKE